MLLNQLIRQEPLLSEKRKPQLEKLVNKLIDKLEENADQSFYLFKILRAHILPLTNCAFNKSGDRFITGSYDRTVSAPPAHSRVLESGAALQLPPRQRPADSPRRECSRSARCGTRTLVRSC